MRGEAGLGSGTQRPVGLGKVGGYETSTSSVLDLTGDQAGHTHLGVLSLQVIFKAGVGSFREMM